MLETVGERAWLAVEKLRNEVALRESEERFSKAFNTTPHLMTITKLEGGQYLSVNDSVVQATGYTREEMIGRTADELNIFAEPEGRAKLLNAFQKGVVRDLEIRLRMKTGEIRLLNLSADIINVQGEKCILTTSTDITESHAAEENLKYQTTLLEALTESILDGILIVSTDGRMLYSNKRFLDIWNFPSEVVRAKSDELALEWAAGQTTNPAAFLARVKSIYAQPDNEVREEVLMKDGRVFDRFGAPIQSGNTQYGWVWTFRDITSSKQAEVALREINQRFSATYELAPVGIVESSPEGRYINSNEQFCAITGYNKKELSELGMQKITHAEDFPADFEFYQKLVTGELPFYQIEKRYVRRDGSILWCDLFRSAVRNADGKTLYTIGAVSDITTRKLAEAALRESEESYRILAETASDAIIRIDENSNIEFVNTATERIFGYAPKEMVGQSLTMLMPEEMRQKHRAGFGRYLTTGKRNLRWESIEVPARHKDGHHFPLEISFGEYNRDGKRFFIGVARDISERRQAEKLLRESEERFAKAFNSSPLSITITSLDTGKLIEVNETFVEITGYSREEAIGRTTAELGLWQPNVRDAELETIKRKGQISNTEYQFRLKDGTEIVGLLSAELLEIGGEPCALTVIQDITTRKRAEELIRESEEKFRNLANSISQFAWMADASGYIFWFNERWFEYTGTTLEEMQGWDWQKVHHPAEVERVTLKFKRHIASGEIWEDTFPLRSKTGEYRWFLSRALPIRNEHGNIVRWFGTNTDIEEVRQARLQAEAANRLKDEFLATVSHELRTPLNAILGWSNMIQTGKANDETKIRANEIIYLNAKSQAALIEDLLDVSSIITGKMKLEPHPVKFALVVESAIDTIRSAADAKSIELETNIECEPCIIGGDAQRLQQVVWNLISNAVKFTPEGGKIAVKLENGNSRARLTIKDSGKGIEAEFLPYIFERFRQEDASSTRRHGGLGLGLAIVRHLVELHGGTISAMSAGENLGSTFTIELPLI